MLCSSPSVGGRFSDFISAAAALWEMILYQISLNVVLSCIVNVLKYGNTSSIHCVPSNLHVKEDFHVFIIIPCTVLVKKDSFSLAR